MQFAGSASPPLCFAPLCLCFFLTFSINLKLRRRWSCEGSQHTTTPEHRSPVSVHEHGVPSNSALVARKAEADEHQRHDGRGQEGVRARLRRAVRPPDRVAHPQARGAQRHRRCGHPRRGARRCARRASRATSGFAARANGAMPISWLTCLRRHDAPRVQMRAPSSCPVAHNPCMTLSRSLSTRPSGTCRALSSASVTACSSCARTSVAKLRRPPRASTGGPP
jgi:hypothetical protein